MLLRSVIGLRFALSLCAALGASITAYFLPFLLLQLSGDVEPNPGPPKRKGELVYVCVYNALAVVDKQAGCAQMRVESARKVLTTPINKALPRPLI